MGADKVKDVLAYTVLAAVFTACLAGIVFWIGYTTISVIQALELTRRDGLVILAVVLSVSLFLWALHRINEKQTAEQKAYAELPDISTTEDVT